MSTYQVRKIKFKELLEIAEWKIKVYTISKEEEFNFPGVYKNVKEQLNTWLKQENGFNAKHYRTGFLILHVASEGIFSIINWWLDGYMLNTNIYLTDYNCPDNFKKISGNGLGPCVWELEVINHERIAWTKHVLKQAPEVDFKSYLSSNFNKEL